MYSKLLVIRSPNIQNSLYKLLQELRCDMPIFTHHTAVLPAAITIILMHKKLVEFVTALQYIQNHLSIHFVF
jgi:hypothetical protein